VAHFIYCLQCERADMGEGFEATTKNHPLVSRSIKYCGCRLRGLRLLLSVTYCDQILYSVPFYIHYKIKQRVIVIIWLM
jgi:hypothetical protein